MVKFQKWRKKKREKESLCVCGIDHLQSRNWMKVIEFLEGKENVHIV